MMRTPKIAVIVLALAVSPLALTGVARAADIRFNVGDVAIGYSDGYWDHHHRWHAWEREDHREAYRREKNAEYHEWRHDRDRDMGWHEHH